MKSLPTGIIPSFVCIQETTVEEDNDSLFLTQQTQAQQHQCMKSQSQVEVPSLSKCSLSTSTSSSPTTSAIRIQQQQQKQQQEHYKKVVLRDLMTIIETKESISCSQTCPPPSPTVYDGSGTTASSSLSFHDVYHRTSILLGQGGFSSVYQCQHKYNHYHYAVKEVVIMEEEEEEETSCRKNHSHHHHALKFPCIKNSAQQEIEALRHLQDGPFIVKLLDVFQQQQQVNDDDSTNATTTTRTIYHLILEEVSGGDLMDEITTSRCIPELQSKVISRQLLEAIRYCHLKGIAHRDIKPENILLKYGFGGSDDIHIQLADFGSSQKFNWNNNSTYFRTLCGTPLYAAPEIYQTQMNHHYPTTSSNYGYDERCDIWSIGIVIFTMLGGYFPFDASIEELPTIICEGIITWDERYWDPISFEAKELICNLLQVSVTKRITIHNALHSSWIQRSCYRNHYQQHHTPNQHDVDVDVEHDDSRKHILSSSLYGCNEKKNNDWTFVDQDQSTTYDGLVLDSSSTESCTSTSFDSSNYSDIYYYSHNSWSSLATQQEEQHQQEEDDDDDDDDVVVAIPYPSPSSQSQSGSSTKVHEIFSSQHSIMGW